MTIPELNALPYITANIEHILRYLESDSMDPEWFIHQGAKNTEPDPMREVLQQELPGLMAEYRRLTAYINGITDPYMKRVLRCVLLSKNCCGKLACCMGSVAEH